jgi:multiple sugar transport system ATP-binding protein
MRSEIKRLHREIATTMIYVTHDQIEAMTLADRIVLLRDGVIEQQGSPLELFERPRTRFVAGFLGSPQMNFVPVRLARAGRGLELQFEGGTRLSWPNGQGGAATAAVGREMVLGIRPEHMRRASGAKAAAGHSRLPVTVELVQPTGSRTFITTNLGGVPIMAELAAHDVRRPGEEIDLDLDLTRAILIDPATGLVFDRQPSPGGPHVRN